MIQKKRNLISERKVLL